MEPKAILAQVLERWKKAFGQYRAFRATVEPVVMRWEWTTGERYSLLPFHFNRYPGRASALKKPPTSAGNYWQYGFDEQDRPRLRRSFGYLDLQDIERLRRDRFHPSEKDKVQETFFLYSDPLVEIIEYSISPRIPLHVEQVFFEDGRVVRYASFRLNGYTPLYSQKGRNPAALYTWLGPNGRFKQVEQYLYDGNRLSSILLYIEQPGVPAFEAEDRFSYDEQGRLQRIDRLYQDGVKQLLHRKREKGETFQTIRESATQRMIAAIVERLRAENIQEKLSCIELSYQAALNYFPPHIHLGRESDRQKLLVSGNPTARFYVFSPALLGEGQSLEITDP